MADKFTGKVAVITGGSTGMGLATAKRFIQQADEAMRTKNLVFARNLADKAAVLAAQLGGR